MSEVNFDDFTKNYNDLLRQGTQFFTQDETYFAQYKVQLARSIINSEPTRILEYGCGIGRNMSFLRQYFKSAEICGSDISTKSLDVAKAENPGIYFWQEGDEISERSGFDLIFVAGVFHHIPPNERTDAVKKIHSRLNNGGSVVVFEHNPYNPVTQRLVNNCPYDKDAVLLAPREVRTHLEKAGLCVVKHAYALFVPPSLKMFSRLENRLGWLPLGGQYWVHAIKA